MASLEDAAAHIFIGPERFTQLRKAGYLPKPRGRAGYVLDDVRRAYIDHLKAGIDTESPDVGGAERQKHVDDLARERARHAAESADKIALQNREKRRELVPVSAVRDYCTEVASLIRPRLEALPARCKVEIPHLRASEVAVIRREVTRVTDEIADIQVDRLIG